MVDELDTDEQGSITYPNFLLMMARHNYDAEEEIQKPIPMLKYAVAKAVAIDAAMATKTREEVCASATQSTAAVEEALRFFATSGDKVRLMALLERGIVNVEAQDEVKSLRILRGLLQ